MCASHWQLMSMLSTRKILSKPTRSQCYLVGAAVVFIFNSCLNDVWFWSSFFIEFGSNVCGLNLLPNAVFYNENVFYLFLYVFHDGCIVLVFLSNRCIFHMRS